MNKIYWWYPSKKNEWKLIFEFVDGIEKEVDEEFVNNNSMLNDLHEIQNLIDNFYDNYLKG